MDDIFTIRNAWQITSCIQEIKYSFLTFKNISHIDSKLSKVKTILWNSIYVKLQYNFYPSMRSIKEALKPLFSEQSKKNNSASKGTTDILVIEHQDGTLHATPFLLYVGQKYQGTTINISINDRIIQGTDLMINQKGYLVIQITQQFLFNLGLNYGKNKISYILNPQKQVRSEIFLYSQQDRFVISDMDGTMTKNDLGGLFHNYKNQHFIHEGFEELMEKANSHGYHIIFLTMRPFVLYKFTKNYLDSHLKCQSILILQNSHLLSSIAKQALNLGARYKQRTMNVLIQLFPKGCYPFYAAFGNKKGDQLVYNKAGVSCTHIFIINQQSQILSFENKTICYKNIEDSIQNYFPIFHVNYKDWKKKIQQFMHISHGHKKPS